MTTDTAMEKLQYKLDVFEGPLDMLLSLILKNKLDIYDISGNNKRYKYNTVIVSGDGFPFGSYSGNQNILYNG